MDTCYSASQEIVFGEVYLFGILTGLECRYKSLAPLKMATVLIAEDYDDNRELLRIILSSAGYDVHEARNGTECVNLARQSRPDLVMVDLSMPELDGWGVFRALRADPMTEKIPCVAVTAHVDFDREKVLKSGFDAFVGKPFRTDELLATVKKLTEK